MTDDIPTATVELVSPASDMIYAERLDVLIVEGPGRDGSRDRGAALRVSGFLHGDTDNEISLTIVLTPALIDALAEDALTATVHLTETAGQ